MISLKRLTVFFSVTLLLFFSSFNNVFINKYQIKTVVIDAGHGGADPGAVGTKAHEKDITLAIALKLGAYIEKAFPEIKVIYTRKTDVFVELYKRAQIANENNADLFISIHCNANKNKAAYGAETYVMGLHKSEANLEVAKKENSAILFEDNYIAKYDGFNPNSPEANIIFSLFQNAFLDQSLDFSAKIQQQFKERVGLLDRGVKQAGFLLLYKTTMPGVLIETGFISNASDQEFLISEKGQDYIASAIFRAFKEYKSQVEGNPNELLSIKEQQKNKENLPDSTKPYQKIVQITDTAKTIGNKNEKPEKKPKVEKVDNNVFFKVQIATTAKLKPIDSPDFAGLKDVSYYEHGGLFKYTVGNEKTLEAAVKLQADLQAKGYKDAFVVAFANGERIPPSDAVKLINKK